MSVVDHTEIERTFASLSSSLGGHQNRLQVQEAPQPEARQFGQVVCAPFISVPAGDCATLKGCEIWESSRSTADTARHFEPQAIECYSFDHPTDGLFTLAGVLSISDMFHPLHKDRNKDMMEDSAKTGMSWELPLRSGL